MNTALALDSAPTLPLSLSPAADNDAPANGCEPGPQLVRFGARSLFALLGEDGPRRPRIRRGEGDQEALVGDAEVDLLATAELVFRRQWAAELGLDPRTADLDRLSGVSPMEELEGDTSL